MCYFWTVWFIKCRAVFGLEQTIAVSESQTDNVWPKITLHTLGINLHQSKEQSKIIHIVHIIITQIKTICLNWLQLFAKFQLNMHFNIFLRWDTAEETGKWSFQVSTFTQCMFLIHLHQSLHFSSSYSHETFKTHSYQYI